MRVLMTGATGFLGRNMCRSLIGDGHEVVAFSRNAESARRKLPGVSDAITWNPVDAPPPVDVFEGADAVINLAGENLFALWTPSKKRAVRRSRIESTKNVVSGIAGVSAKPRVLISASAVGYYGDKGDESIVESDPPGSGFLSNLCEEWESEAARAADHGVRTVMLRTGLALGPGGGMLPAVLPVAKSGLLGSIGSGRQWWPWVHIDDIVGTARFALANEVQGPLNVVSPEPVRQKEFARTLAGLLGRPAFMKVPAFVLRLAGGVAEESLASQRVIPKKAAEAGYKHRYSDLRAALSDLIDKM